MTRQERRALNKRAHAIRRELVNADYRESRAAGESIRWRDIAAIYDAMSAADVVATFDARQDEPETVTSTTTRKRRGPAHVRRAREAHALADEAWRAGLDAAVAGGRTLADGGKPARGERWPDEERDYRESHPRPMYRDFLAAEYAAMREPVAA